MQGESQVEAEETGEIAGGVAAERSALPEPGAVIEPQGGSEVGGGAGFQEQPPVATRASLGDNRGKDRAADSAAERVGCGPHRLDLAFVAAQRLQCPDTEQAAVLARGEERYGGVGERGTGQDVAGFGRRVGVHGGDMEGEQLLDIGLVELALIDGDRHGGDLSQVRVKRRGEALTATFGRRAASSLGKSAGMMDEQAAWDAFEARDRKSDDRFVVAVTTTRIYCRPSCPARRPRREHVRFYGTGREAAEAGYRACLRCKPDSVARDRAAVTAALTLLGQADETVSLQALASAVGYAPHHFQRLFTREVGVSPAAWQRARRLSEADRRLSNGTSVTEAIYEAGYSAPSRFYADAKAAGLSPAALRKGGEGMVIDWARVDSGFGPLLIAATERGLCRVSFDEDVASLSARYPAAELIENPEAPLIVAARAAIDDPALAASLPTDVSGTAFQQRVWAELRRIPPGETRSYLDIARALGDPNATRAVGTANGANPIAIIVPCHRVVRNDGSLGGYAGGLERKKDLLAAETKQSQGSLL